jgi:tetratricopeptide (TPR) repeat protein
MSYSHQDARWAAWLHRKLESYRVPRRLRQTDGRFGIIPERLHPIFRDREELASSGALGDRLREALTDSDALIVVCSPDAARSRWVNAEVESFMSLGRGDRIYCLIVDGEPNAGDARECFPPALRYMAGSGETDVHDPIEPIAADLRPGKDGRKLALLKLVAGLIGTDLDSLRNREAQRHHRRMLGAVVASLCGMVLAMGLATTAWIARNDAQRRQEQAQDLIVFMLGNLHDKLEKVGRLDLLDSLGGKAINYLTHLNPRDLNDTTLKQLVLAETQLGQVRLDQGRYADALSSFRGGYERSRALAHRHPTDGSLLFDRGQAEFWIGYVYWQSRQLDKARAWLTRYRDTSRTVYAMNPARADWKHELAYGDHNLAAVELELGQLQQAAKSFSAAHRILASLQARTPADTQLRFEVADEASWQGSVQEQYGHIDQAEKAMASKTRVMADIVARHPDDPNWKLKWSTAQLQQAGLLRVLGRYAQSESVADETVARMQTLVMHDPTNKDWSQAYLHALIERAAARLGSDNVAGARSDLALAEPLIVQAMKLRARNRLVRRHIQSASQLDLILAMRENDPRAARAASRRLMSLYRKDDSSQPSEDLGREASSEVLAGMVDQTDGRLDAARAHFDAAQRLLRPTAQHSSYWRILDPWVRVCLLTGHPREAQQARARLARSGYVPLYPWPQAKPVQSTRGLDT